MKIDNSFNPKGLGIKQDVKLVDDSTVNTDEKSLFDKLMDILANKYLWGVILIILALVLGINIFS